MAAAYLAWSLLAAEVLFAAARNSDMPRALNYKNRHKTPAAALLLTNLFIQLVLILTLFSEDAFFMVVQLTSSMALIPYFLVAAYALKLAWEGETYELPTAPRRAHLLLAGLAIIYTVFLLWAAGMKFVLLSTLLYAPGTLLYIWARRERGQRVIRPMEWGIFLLATAGFVLAVHGLAKGYISI